MEEKSILYTWLGGRDIKACEGASFNGPILDAVLEGNYHKVVLLSNDPEEKWRAYCFWFRNKTEIDIQPRPASFEDPSNFEAIYEHARYVLELHTKLDSPQKRTFYISPGTSFMTAVWILLSTIYKPDLIKGHLSKENQGATVDQVHLPFDIVSTFHPGLSEWVSSELTLGEAFNDIIWESPIMERVLKRVAKAGPRDVSVLITGDSGTGKELVSEAIHKVSGRKGQLVALNCAAIPRELVESELFGYCKGSHATAHRDMDGKIHAAAHGTLFLDEIGEMPMETQAKLLRVLQTKKVQRLGSAIEEVIPFRLVTATHRDLRDLVRQGLFRQDLYYRIAVAHIHIPSLYQRPEDIRPLANHLWALINERAKKDCPSYQPKQLSAGALDVLATYHWPGNVRQLENILKQVSVWSEGCEVTSEEIRDRLQETCGPSSWLDRPLGNGFNLDHLISEIDYHYISRAMTLTRGKFSGCSGYLGISDRTTGNRYRKACELLGYPNHDSAS